MAKLTALKDFDLPQRRVHEGEDFEVDEKYVAAFLAMGKAKRYEPKDLEAENDPDKPRRTYRRRDMTAQ